MARNHDALFDAGGRRAFCGGLRRHGYTYDTLAAELERAGLPRPSEGSAVYRSMILQAAALLPHAEPWELCARISPLYRPELHIGAVLPAEDNGYIAALLGTAPQVSVCAEGAAPTHTTHCPGQRIWFGESCRAPIVADSGDCSEVAE